MQAASWRWAFFINLPLAAAAMYITVRHIPESRDPGIRGRLDWPGGGLITAGLAGVIYTLIEVPDAGWTMATISALAGGGACLAAFIAVEARTARPMLPLAIFRSAQFGGANLTTLTVYAAQNGALFLLAVQLQQSLHYSPLDAGAAVLPAAAVFGLGLSVTVAPLTAAVLAALSQGQAGLASGTNNAVARIAGLFGVAILPLLAGVSTSGGQLGPGVSRAMLIAAGVCAAGGLIAWATIPSRPAGQPDRRVPACAESAPGNRWRRVRLSRVSGPATPSRQPGSAPPLTTSLEHRCCSSGAMPLR